MLDIERRKSQRCLCVGHSERETSLQLCVWIFFVGEVSLAGGLRQPAKHVMSLMGLGSVSATDATCVLFRVQRDCVLFPSAVTEIVL